MASASLHRVSALVDQDLFRNVVGHFASGVTIVTARAAGRDHGTTTSAVCSLSLEPPMVLVCLNQTSETQAAVRSSGRFAINILGADQGDTAYRFATKLGAAKFDSVGVHAGGRGVPLIDDALAHIECRVTAMVTAATHTVFLAEVEGAGVSGGMPLTYFRGTFGRFETKGDEEAHGGAKVSATGAVARRGAASEVSPLTAHMSDQAYDAGCIIEIGVVDETVASASEDELDQLRQHAEATERAVKGADRELAAYERATGAFHEHVVGLSHNQALVDFYRHLRISSISTRALRMTAWRDSVIIEHPRHLLNAYTTRDVEAAKQAIHEHADHVKRLAREVIEAAGGAL